MNKAEMADRLAARTGLSKSAAKEAVDGTFAAVGDEARIMGFGTFGTRNRPARTGQKPRTGEAVSTSASMSLTFPESIDADKYALELDPAHALAMFNPGGVYWNGGEREQALFIWGKAAEQFPDHELTARLRSELPLPL